MIKDFVPIGNGIMNARIPVKNRVQVSLPYSLHSGRFLSVGTKEEPQGAILLLHSDIEDLYSFNENSTTKQCESTQDIECLINIAESITPNLLISIFDTCDSSPPSWHPRFITQRDSVDHLYKLDYLNQIYKKHEILLTELQYTVYTPSHISKVGHIPIEKSEAKV